jgi:probable phosphoglycerate mutase
MILAMVRHGQTDFNKNRLVQGRINNPLNETGKKQAKDTANELKKAKETFDVLASSPLSRALVTANIIKRRFNFKDPIYIAPYFVERDFTPFDGDTIEHAFPIIGDANFHHPMFETDEMLIERAKYALNLLYEKFKDKKVLLVAHSHIIKALLISVDPKKFDFIKYYVDNSSVHYIEVTDEGIKFLGARGQVSS